MGEVTKYTGPYPFLDGLILRCTHRIGTLEVRHQPRSEGRSGYNLRKLFRVWLNMFLNFSVIPLRVSSVLGLSLVGVGVILGIVAIFEKFLNPGSETLGWSSIIVSVITFSGMQLIMLGLLGEYLGHLFLSSNQTPQFVIREICRGEDQRERLRCR